MRFIQTFSTALVTALLATSALGHVPHPHPRSGEGAAHQLSDRGTPSKTSTSKTSTKKPTAADKATFMKQYCSKAVSKSKRSLPDSDLDADDDTLWSDDEFYNPTGNYKVDSDTDLNTKLDTECETCNGGSPLTKRSKPSGYTEVSMGKNLGRKGSGPGLWSGGFGTCVGVAVVGIASSNGGYVGYLAHLSGGSIFSEWTRMAQDIHNAKMSNMRATVYTVDTRASAADVRADSYMTEMARLMEQDFADLMSQVQSFVGRGRPVERRYHAFSQVGEMMIGTDNRISTSP